MNSAAQQEEFPEIPVSRYKVVQKLGYGAFSVVFLAYTPDQQRRAIKRIRLTSKPKMMLKEIEFMKHLQGKETISQLKEVLFSEQTYYTSIVTSYLETTEFRQMLHQFTPEIVQQYMFYLLTALSHLEGHNGGILHRDVKPGNFLFDIKTRRGMLIDFGLAQSFKEAQMFAQQPLLTPVERTVNNLPKFVNIFYVASQYLPKQPHAGTHGYRAPEVLFPLYPQTQKIDIWSTGVILLYILTGKTGLFRSPAGTDTYEVLAIRNILGTDRFIYGMGKLKVDFGITAGICMPNAISIEELAMWNNPDLFVMLTPCVFDLCRRLLEFDFANRLSASDALQHYFFYVKQKTTRYYNGSYQKSILTQYESYQQDVNYWVYSYRMTDICAILNLSAAYREKILDVYLVKKIQNLEYDKDVKQLVYKLLKKYHLNAKEEINMYGYKINRNVDLYDYNYFESLTTRCTVNYLLVERHPSMSVDSKFSPESIYCANEQQERLQRIRRNTAIRRKIDPFVYCVKALNCEWQAMQEKVRETAEEYRRAAIDLIKKDVIQIFSGATIVPAVRPSYNIDTTTITSFKGYQKCQAAFFNFLLNRDEAVFETLTSQPECITQIYRNISQFASISYRIAINADNDYSSAEYARALSYLREHSSLVRANAGYTDDAAIASLYPEANENASYRATDADSELSTVEMVDDGVSDSISLSETYFDPEIMSAPNFYEAYYANADNARMLRGRRRRLHSAEHIVFDYQLRKLRAAFVAYERQEMYNVRTTRARKAGYAPSVSAMVCEDFENIIRSRSSLYAGEQQLSYLASREYYRQRSIEFLLNLLRSPLGMYFANPAALYKSQVFSPSRLYANMRHASEQDQARVRKTLTSLADLCMYYAQTQLCRKDLIIVNSCLGGLIDGIPIMRGAQYAKKSAQMPSYQHILDNYPKTAKYLESQCQNVIYRVLAYPAAIDDAITELEFAHDAIESRIVEVLVEELYYKAPTCYLYRDLRAAIKAYGAQFALQVMKGANMYCFRQRQNCLDALGRRKRTARFSPE